MKISRVLLVIAILYSWAMAVKMIVLSMLAMMAFNCMFPSMKSEPLAYLLYLMYFRSRHCEQSIDWTALGLGDRDLLFVDAEMRQQRAAVTRTYVIAIHYMIFNVFLSLFAVGSLLSMRKRQNGKVFNSMFTGLVVASVAVLVLDFTAMTLYITDSLRARTPDGLMRILEIKNSDEVRHLFEAIPFEKRVLPSIIMIFATSKGILLLIVNVILMSIVISTNYVDRKEKSNSQIFTARREQPSNGRRFGTIQSPFTPD